MEVVVLIALLLPAGLVEVLTEVALLVEQADAHQGHAQVARRLQVIPGQNPQATGEDRQAFGQAELGGKIGHHAGPYFRVRAPAPTGLVADVVVQLIGDTIQVRDKRFIRGGGFEPFLIDRTEHLNRVMPAGFPEIAVEPAEKLYSLLVPGPKQVVGDFPQRFEDVRE